MKKYLYVSPYYEEPSFKSYFNSINLINNTDWLTTNNHLILNKKNLKKTSLFNYLENNSNKYDLIFFCSNSILLNKIEIIKLSKSNKLVLISFDDEYQFYQNLFFAQYCKFVLCTELISSYRYKYYNINSYFLPHPVQDFDHIIDKNVINNEIVFIGNSINSKHRKYYLDEIRKNFDNVKIIDTSENISSRKSDNELHDIYNKSLAVLNFTKLSKNKIQKKNLNNDDYIDSLFGFKGRPYEVGIAGGLSISEWNFQLEKHFTNKKNILFFKNIQELKNIINDLLNAKFNIIEIRKNAYELIKNNFTEIVISKKLKNIIDENKNFTINYNNTTHPHDYEIFYFLKSLDHKINNEMKILKKIYILISEFYKNFKIKQFYKIFIKFIKSRYFK